MGDDDNNTSSSEDNTPRTPPHTGILRPKNTARSFTAPSKLPKPTPYSTRYPLSPARAQTRSSPAVPTTPLDWGSSGEWSLWSGDIKRRSPTVDMSSLPTAESESLLEEEGEEEEASDGQMLPSAPVESAARALQSAISLDSTFDETHEREDADAEQSTMSLPTTAEKVERETATPQSSRPMPVLRFDTNTVYCEAGSGQMLKRISLANSRASNAGAVRSTENTELPTSQVKKPLAATSNLPASNPRAKKSTEPSPQTKLRNMILGANREMKYFTLPNDRFTLDDLRQGLDYAFGMLQAAQSKLAILTVLRDDMMDVSAVELRS